MSTSLPATMLTRLEKVAVDNGFDLELPREGDWLRFASSQAPLQIWLSLFAEAVFVVGFSQLNVARALSDYGVLMSGPLPPAAVAGRSAADIPTLHNIVRRAFQLSRTLPDELLRAFEREIAVLPRTTEVERLVVQRVGQDIFRDGLFDFWDRRCAVTGLDVRPLLRASHIKPWADCGTDGERLDVFNGILLAPNLDAAFDQGFVTFADNGAITMSGELGDESRHALALDSTMRLRSIADGHRHYLRWHRARVFKISSNETVI